MPPPSKPVGTASATAKVDTSAQATTPATDKKQPHKLTLGLDANLLWQFNGYNSSYVFNDRYGKIGDYTDKNLGAFLLFNLLPLSNFKLWMGPRLQVDSTDGNQNTSGSSFQSYTGGLQVEPDWGHWTTLANGHLQLFPSLGLYTTAGYGRGTGQAETISLHKQEGFAWNIGAKLPVARVKVGDFAFSAGPAAQTQVIDGKVFNTATTGVGFFLDARADVTPKEPEKVVVKEPPPPPPCPDLRQEIEKKLAQIKGIDGQPGLIAQVQDYEKKVVTKREWLKTRPRGPLDDAGVLKTLRDQRALDLAKDEIKAANLDFNKTEDVEKYNTILEKYRPQAEKDFPSAEAFWTPKTPSLDYENLELNGPTNDKCEDLDKMLGKVQKTFDNLQSRLNELKKIYDTPFSVVRDIVTKAAIIIKPQFKKIHFENDKPSEGELNKAIKAIEANKTANGGKINWNDGKLVAAIRPIFDGPKSGTKYTNEVVKIIQDSADVLNGDLMKEIKGLVVEGHTSLAGSDDHNLKLSDRRAKLIREMLIGAGVDASRLSAKGYGETRPLRPDEETHPKNSAERGAAAGENRRMELYIPEAEIIRLETEGVIAPTLDSPKKEEPKKTGGGDQKPAPAKPQGPKAAAAPAKPAASAPKPKPAKPQPKGGPDIEGLPE